MEEWKKVSAFRVLLESAMRTKFDKLYRAVPLEKHPFGLTRLEESFSRNDYWREHIRQLHFIGQPHATDIESMRREAIKLLTGPVVELDQPCLRLRVIFVEADEINKDQHLVFYEMANPASTIMCGGCTDFSGTGGNGKEQMDAFFALLADIYSAQIEIVTVPYSKTTSTIRLIEDAIAEYHRE